MNWVTREQVLQVVAEVKEGRTFCLSLPLDYPGGNVLNPRRNPPRIASTLRSGKQNFCYPLDADTPGFTDVVSDDLVLLTLQYSTQWDSFAHVGGRFDADGDGKAELVFYNGFRAGEHLLPASEKKDAASWDKFEGTNAKALGIEKLAEHGVQGRGVMIDLHAHFGRERRAVGYDDLMRVLEKVFAPMYRVWIVTTVACAGSSQPAPSSATPPAVQPTPPAPPVDAAETRPSDARGVAQVDLFFAYIPGHERHAAREQLVHRDVLHREVQHSRLDLRVRQHPVDHIQ
jgi:hypothetical protein